MIRFPPPRRLVAPCLSLALAAAAPCWPAAAGLGASASAQAPAERTDARAPGGRLFRMPPDSTLRDPAQRAAAPVATPDDAVTATVRRWGAPPAPYELVIEKLPAPVNTDAYDEISPVLSRDGRRLFFTRSGAPDFNRNLLIDGTDARDSLDEAGYERLLRRVYAQIGGSTSGAVHTSRFNQDIWVAEFDRGGALRTVRHPDTPLNNALPNALAAAMPEPGHYLVINRFPERGGMEAGFSHTHQRADGSWTWPRPVEIDGYYKSGEGVGATLSDDGEVMILSLQRGDGRGLSDLYVSRRIDSTHYSRPENLGPDINTEFRESTPSLSEDKRTLYFSSNRWGRGGNDVYFCRRLDDSWTNWSLARRFKPPISSERDDSQPYFNEASGYLYFTSNRDGSSDIYRVRVQKPKPLDILIVGRVKHARTGEPLDAVVQVVPRGRPGEDTLIATRKGRFDLRVDNLMDLTFAAEKEGFIGHVERLSMRRQSYLNAYEIDILLDPQEKGGTITLDPIYFEQSRAVIRPESTPQLERLRDVLRRYPNIYVRIEGHTDNQGPESALDKLSRERAEAIRAYLLANGVARTRVQAAGYGGRRPVSENETEAGRVANRRVEVVITRILPPVN